MKKTFLLLATVLLFCSVTAQNKKEIGKYTSKKARSGFIENKGQIHDQKNKVNSDVKYLLNSGNGINVQLKKNSFSYDTYKTVVKEGENNTSLPNSNIEKKITYYFHRVDVELVGANENPQIITEEPSTAYLNYYNTLTTESGATKIHSYKRITYKDIYKGIDMVFSAQTDKEKPVEYNFVVHPGADASQIQIHYKGANGTQLTSNKINIEVAQGKLTENIPASYLKEINKKLEVTYKNIGKDIYGFEIPSYNSSQTLIIDPNPNLDWSTYYGGSDDESGTAITCDNNGNVFVTGYTSSLLAIASNGAYQDTLKGEKDAFIVKFDNNGNRLWGTYYGGTNDDQGTGIACDANGNVVITGYTNSNDLVFPTGAHQATYGNGVNDAFIAKFDNNGAILYGSYYGGSGDDRGTGITCDLNSNIYITGYTSSSNAISASTSSYQAIIGGGYDAFIVKFNSTGVRQWATYYGGNGDDYGMGIAHDVGGNIYITGYTNTNSTDTIMFSRNALDSIFSGIYDIFVVKLKYIEGTRIWGTLYGGSGDDRGYGIACDNSGDAFITGVTNSYTNIAKTSGTDPIYQTTLGGGTDAFILKLKSNGALKWCTYYGGLQNDVANGIACDNNGNNIYITGYTNSYNAIATNSSYQSAYGGGTNYGDAFALNFDGSDNLQWGTYFGGSDDEYGTGVSIDNNENVFITGSTESQSAIATDTAFQNIIGGGEDAFVAKFSTCPLPPHPLEVSANIPICIPQSISDSTSFSYIQYFPNLSYVWTLPDDSIITTSSNTIYLKFNQYLTDTTLYLKVHATNSCGNGDTLTYPIPVHLTPQAPYIEFTSADSITITSNKPIGNQWYNVDTSISVINNQTCIATSDGYYHATITVNGCTSAWSNVLHVTHVGIGVYEDNNGISIYPNPAKNKLTIDFQNINALQNTFISIYDIQGQLLLQQAIIQQKTEVNINNLAKGIYVLKINNNNNTTITKFVKE